MSATGYWVIAFSCCALAWLMLAAYTVADRVRHDRAMRRLTGRLDGAKALDELSYAQQRARILAAARFATRGKLESIIVDNAQPAWVRDCLAALILERYGRVRLVREAGRKSWRRSGWRRLVAWEVLYRTDSGNLHALLRVGIHDSDPLLANAAATILGKLGDQPAAQILVDALRTSNCSPRLLAIQLEQVDASTRAEAVLPLLSDQQPGLRAWGIALLSGCRSVERLDERLALLSCDEHPDVRKAVAQAMGQIGNAAACKVLLELIHDKIGFVRANAVRALHQVSKLNCAPDLLRGLPALQNDNDWWVRLAVREALSAYHQAPGGATPAAALALPPQDRPDHGGIAGVRARPPAFERSPS